MKPKNSCSIVTDFVRKFEVEFNLLTVENISACKNLHNSELFCLELLKENDIIVT